MESEATSHRASLNQYDARGNSKKSMMWIKNLKTSAKMWELPSPIWPIRDGERTITDTKMSSDRIHVALAPDPWISAATNPDSKATLNRNEKARVQRVLRNLSAPYKIFRLKNHDRTISLEYHSHCRSAAWTAPRKQQQSCSVNTHELLQQWRVSSTDRGALICHEPSESLRLCS